MTEEMDSSISGFYKLSVSERLDIASERAGLSIEDAKAISSGLPIEKADSMIENVIGTFGLPLGVAVNFKINNKDYLVPMVTEEPSVVAAASNAAKMARATGGFIASASEPVMIGQIQLKGAGKDAPKRIEAEKSALMEFAESLDPTLVRFGGGVKDLQVRSVGEYAVVHLHVNVADAMGANAVNTMCEALAPRLEELSGGRAILKILSNFAVERTAKASCTIKKETVGGEEVAERIVDAWSLADQDVYRAVTHNKGVMNGITALVMATGNDTRAVEAGCHAFAARDGAYRSLTRWCLDDKGDLVGEIEVPVAVGLVGGATKTHPVAQAALKMLGVRSAAELGQVMACVGLAQNLGALRALSAEGIQKGHMRLHAKNIAILAGAPPERVDEIAQAMAESGKVSVDEAKRILSA